MNSIRMQIEDSRRERLKRLYIVIIIGCGVITSICILAYRYREDKIQSLFLEAGGYTSYFRDTTQSVSATRRLAAYRGSDATERLVTLAVGYVAIPMPQVQEEAIKALADRPDDSVGPDLASLLQPSSTYEVRESVAKTLTKIPCNSRCVSEILHYFERVWGGELNYEERNIPFGETEKAVKQQNDKLEAPVYDQLLSVLQREHTTTVDALERVYGLGTVAPSKFALIVVSRAGFRDVCPLLRKTQRDLAGTESWFIAPRSDLANAIQELGCR